MYIGNGDVIEARGHAYGVVKTKLKDRIWTSWGKLPELEYVEEKEMFNLGDEMEAIEFLVDKGKISDKDYWIKTLDVVKNQQWVFIKWANDVKQLSM